MTNNSGNDIHIGFIRSIHDGEIEVGVEPPVACSSCEVSSSCGLADKEEKIITIQDTSRVYSVGDTVSLSYEEKLSTKAMLLVYVIPVFLVALTLFITQLYTKNELIIGLIALMSLFPYFLLFKFFNKSIQRIFSFRIDKLSGENTLSQIDEL